jgi:hypothetical protein
VKARATGANLRGAVPSKLDMSFVSPMQLGHRVATMPSIRMGLTNDLAVPRLAKIVRLHGL